MIQYNDYNQHVKLLKCAFGDIDRMLLLIDGAFIFDVVDNGTPIAVLSTSRFVPFTL